MFSTQSDHIFGFLRKQQSEETKSKYNDNFVLESYALMLCHFKDKMKNLQSAYYFYLFIIIYSES